MFHIYNRIIRKKKLEVIQKFARPHSSGSEEGVLGRVVDLVFDFAERNPTKVPTRLREDVRLRFDRFFGGGSEEGAAAI